MDSASNDAMPKKKPDKIKWPSGDPAIKQNFPFRYNLIHYITMNPSTPKAYSKLIESCKYFFEVNPIIVVPYITNGRIFCPTKCRDMPRCCVPIDITKFINKVKFWFVSTFKLDIDDLQNYTSIICPKIYRCEIDFLCIQKDKIVNFEDFKLLALSVKGILIDGLTMKHQDGSVIQLEEMLKCCPNIQILSYFFASDESLVNTSTLKNIQELQTFKELESFRLHRIPECFSVEDLSALIKDNKEMSFQLDFHNSISDDYMNLLDVLIEEVIESEIPNRIIWYPGLNEEILQIMEDRYIAESALDDYFIN